MNHVKCHYHDGTTSETAVSLETTREQAEQYFAGQVFDHGYMGWDHDNDCEIEVEIPKKCVRIEYTPAAPVIPCRLVSHFDPFTREYSVIRVIEKPHAEAGGVLDRCYMGRNIASAREANRDGNKQRIADGFPAFKIIN